MKGSIVVWRAQCSGCGASPLVSVLPCARVVKTGSVPRCSCAWGLGGGGGWNGVGISCRVRRFGAGGRRRRGRRTRTGRYEKAGHIFWCGRLKRLKNILSRQRPRFTTIIRAYLATAPTLRRRRERQFAALRSRPRDATGGRSAQVRRALHVQTGPGTCFLWKEDVQKWDRRARRPAHSARRRRERLLRLLLACRRGRTRNCRH